MKIGVVQYAPKLLCKEENMKFVEKLLREKLYNIKLLDILLLPETAFTGYKFPSYDSVKEIAENSTDLNGPTFLWCIKQAKYYKCLVAVGYPEIDNDNKLYNSLMVVSPDGKLFANIRKTFLYETDKNWATAGTNFQTVCYSNLDIKIAFGICMDINPYEFKEPFEKYEFGNFVVQNNVDLILFSCAWIDSTITLDDPLPLMNYWCQRLSPVIDDLHGKEKNIIFVCSNRTGKEDETIYAGSSCVLSLKEPSILQHANKRDDTVLFVEI